MTARYTEEEERLVCAVRKGDACEVREALPACRPATLTAAITDTDPTRGTLLHLAAVLGHASLVPLLVNAGIPIEQKAQIPYTPLMAAAHYCHSDVVQALLAAGANVNAQDDLGKCTSLHLAARMGDVACAKALLKAGADVNLADRDQRTPLHVCVFKGSTTMVQVLLEAGADVNALNSLSFTAMHVAALAGNEAAIQELRVAGVNPEAHDAQGLTPVDVAEAWGRHNTAWLLRKMPMLAYRSASTTTVVRRSWTEYEQAGDKTLSWVKENKLYLLKASVPVNRDGHYQDAQGLTPLHVAAQLGLTETATAMVSSFGCLPRAVTFAGDTPADLARHAGHCDLAQALDDMAKPQRDVSPYVLYEELLLLISGGDDVMAASHLLCRGAPLEPVRDLSTNALALAITCNRPRIVTLLLAAGAPITTMIGGLSLLQLAWRSTDVTIHVKVIITRWFLHMLARDQEHIGQQKPALSAGTQQVLACLRGDKPWEAAWPVQSQKYSAVLMSEAACSNCPVVASFLRQAGAKSFLQDPSGRTPLHAALYMQHWQMAKVLVKDLGATPYVQDSAGTLALDLMHDDYRQELELGIYQREKQQLEDLVESVKDEAEKIQLREILLVQASLFTQYSANSKQNLHSSLSQTALTYGMKVSSQRGLLQMLYLLVTVAGLPTDCVVDPTHDSTALQQAASHGNSSSVAILLGLGADPSRPDRYGHNAVHLAAMFGHESTYELLKLLLQQDLKSRVGMTARQVRDNFQEYLSCYLKDRPGPMNSPTFSDSHKGIKHLLKYVDVRNIDKEVKQITVNFSHGEAGQIKEVMLKEIDIIVKKVSESECLYNGRLALVGSSLDGTRLYAPDEFDVNVVLSDFTDISVEVVKQDAIKEALSGHKLRAVVHTSNMKLKGNTLIKRFYELVKECLMTHTITDTRLSLVPPGVTTTQAGVALNFAWQGAQYPLLLIGVDLVPVLSLAWPAGVNRPQLTPLDLTQVCLSNTADGEWRFSFGGTEAEVLRNLKEDERHVYIACKALLSHLKSEPWMPRDVKDIYTWWDTRKWKLMIPAGFAVKNSFLKLVQDKRMHGITWQPEDTVNLIISVMKGMCQTFVDPSTGKEILVPAKVFAYFGGDFEKPKFGEGAPEIIRALQSALETESQAEASAPPHDDVAGLERDHTLLM